MNILMSIYLLAASFNRKDFNNPTVIFFWRDELNCLRRLAEAGQYTELLACIQALHGYLSDFKNLKLQEEVQDKLNALQENIIKKLEV